MYKSKIVFLYEDSEGNRKRSFQWVDRNGIDDIEGILAEYKEKEIFALKDDNMDEVVKFAIIVETFDVTDGKYQCGSCECYFDKPDDGDCPFCGSGNFVEGDIDEPK